MARIALPAPRPFPSLRFGRPETRLGAPSALAVSWIAMALLFATAALSVYLVQISAVANAGYDLQRMEAERKGWIARNEQLELELAKRQSLAWVESQAVQRLGMVRAEKPIYIQIASANRAEREGGATESAPQTQARARQVETARADRPRARPEPGNPGWALDAVQGWLSLLASH